MLSLALEDDTDQLLDLLSKSNELTTPPPSYSGRHYQLQSPSPPPTTPPRSATPSPVKSPSPSRHHHQHHQHHRRHENQHHKSHEHVTSTSHSHHKEKVRRVHSPTSPTSHHHVVRELNYAGESRQADDGRYRETKVVGNFTPAPHSSSEKRQPLPSSRYALKQLLALLQE